MLEQGPPDLLHLVLLYLQIIQTFLRQNFANNGMSCRVLATVELSGFSLSAYLNSTRQRTTENTRQLNNVLIQTAEGGIVLFSE